MLITSWSNRDDDPRVRDRLRFRPSFLRAISSVGLYEDFTENQILGATCERVKGLRAAPRKAGPARGMSVHQIPRMPG